MASMLFWQFKLANSRKIAKKVAPYVNYNLKIINIKIKKRGKKLNKNFIRECSLSFKKHSGSFAM